MESKRGNPAPLHPCSLGFNNLGIFRGIDAAGTGHGAPSGRDVLANVTQEHTVLEEYVENTIKRSGA